MGHNVMTLSTPQTTAAPMAAPKHILRPRSKGAGPGEATRLCTDSVRRARAGARVHGAGCTRTGATGSEINPHHDHHWRLEKEHARAAARGTGSLQRVCLVKMDPSLAGTVHVVERL